MANIFDQFDAAPAPAPAPALKRPTAAVGNVFDQFDAPATVAAPTQAAPTLRNPNADTGDFMRGLKTAAHQLPQLAGGAVAFGGDVASRASRALGGDGSVGEAIQNYGLDVYKRHENDTQQLSKPSDSFTHVLKNPRDLGHYLKYNAGYMGGQLLESAAVMGAGALAGSEVPVAGNIAGAAAGLVARPMVERMVLKKAAELVAEKGLAKEAAAAAAKAAVKKRLGAEAGAAVAGGALNTGQELGSIYPEALDQAQSEGRTLTGGDLTRVGGSALAAGAVDTLADRLNLGAAARGVKVAEGAGKSVLRRRAAAAGKEMLKQGAIGGGTELAQTALERYGAGQPMTGDEAVQDYVDSTAAGVVGGGMTGAGAGLHVQRPVPGSLTDAANVLQQPATGPMGRAAQEGVANGAVAAAAQAANPPAEAPSAQSTRVDPGVAPWADPATGELANPSPAELIRALADHMVAQHQATGDMRINPQQIAEAWGVPKGAVERTRKAATTRASDQLAAAERAAMAPPAAPAPEPTPEAGTTASIPFMITQQMRADLRALGHTPAAIAGMTPEQANTLLQAGQSVATAPQETTDDERVPEPAPAAPAGTGAEAARAADEQPAAGGEPQQPAGSGAATQPAPDSPAAVAGERGAADAIEALNPPSKEAPADAETPASAAPAPGPGGNPAAVAGDGGAAAAGAAPADATAPTTEAEPKAPVTRAPKAPKGSAAAPANHVHAAIQRIAEGEHPEKVLAEADEATVRAVGAAMGKRFSTKAPLGAMVERIGETAASDRRRLAADALVKMGQQKAAEAPPLQPVPSPAPRSTQSVAARKAESLRVKTPTGEVNGRSHVDHLIKDGYTHLTSTRAGDKLVHSLAKADGTSEKIHARQLAYAQERLAASDTDDARSQNATEGQGRQDGSKTRNRSARPEPQSVVQVVDQREGSDVEPEQPVLPQLRGQGNHAAPGMGEELSGVRSGSGKATESESHAGSDRQQPAVPTRERAVGDETAAGEQPTKERQPDLQRANADTGRVGEGERHGAVDASLSDIHSGNAARGRHSQADKAGATTDLVAAAAAEAAAHPDNGKPEPTPAQVAADNFAKGHLYLHGLDIAIEIPKGGKRRGVDAKGKVWQRKLQHHYGAIRGTQSADGENLDVYLGPHAQDASMPVFVVDQVKPGTQTFDESKVMLGYATAKAARQAYSSNFPKGLKTFGAMHEMSMDEFKAWLKDGDTTRPASERETENVATPTPETPPPGGVSASADAGALDDFGERLEGARKFMPPSLKEELGDDQIATQPLSKFWPADAYKSIEDPASAALAFAARAAVPAKPRVAYKVKRWVEQVKTLRALLTTGMDERSQRIMMDMASRTGHRLHDFFAKVRLLAQLPRETWGRVDRVGEHPDAQKLKTDDELKADGFIRVHDPKLGNDYFRMDPQTGEKTGPRIVPWGDTATVHDSLFKTTPFSSVTIDGKTHTFDGAGQIGPDEVQQVKSLLAGESPKQAAALTKADFEIRSYRSRPEAFINRKGDAEKRPLKTFSGKTTKEAVTEARAWLGDNVPVLEKAWEAVKARDNVSKADTRRKENRAREGVDRRNGKDVTPAMFEQALGFRGVQFGNWVGQGKGAKDRQGMLNEAYDALLDLADLLGIPSRAISLNGSLGLALGARGAGRNNAHFEPSNLVINLTKTKGAGSLAHEWFHALDNYFSRLRGGEVPFNGNQDDYRRNNFITYKPEPAWVHRGDMARAGTRTSADLRTTLQQRGMWKEGQTLEQNAEAAGWQRDPAHKQGVRPEVERAFADLVQALNDSPMAARVRRLDKSADGYWHRIIERGARSFENYVISKLALNGQSNDFLANVADWKAWAERGKNMDRYPYLKPEEEAPVVAAFDKLFDTVQTREDDAGNVALFSIDVDGNESTGRAATTFAEARKAAADFVGHPITNDNGLVPATVSHTTLGKMLSDSAVRKSTSLADHVRAVANLDTLYRTGMLDRTHADSRGEPTIAAIHRVVAPMVGVNGEVLAVKMTVKETTHPNTPNPLYSVETLQVDPVEEGKPARKAPQSGGERAPGQDRNAPQAGFSADVTRMLQEFKDRLFRRVSGEDIPAPSTTAQAEHTARIEQLATAAMGAWKGDDVPRLRVVDTPEQLPPGARFDADGNPSNAYKSAAGMYDGRTIWIVASKHTTDQAGIKKLLTTMAHEGVGHYGMDRIVDRELGAGAWRKIEAATERLRADPDKASPTMRKVLDELASRYPNADATTYAREFMAVTAERGVKNGLLDRVVTAIRRWLRRVMPDLRLSEHELRQLVVASDQYLRIGETQQQRVQSRAALAFSQAADPTTTAAFKRFFGDWERLARPGSYESPGALARPLGETPITGLDAVVRRDLQRVNPDEVSKVVDAAGNPLVLYHGTAEDFSVFGHDRAGEATGHATSPLGHFFTPDRAQAAGYARNASEGRPADERVVDAYVAIRNPYTMILKEAQAIETQAQARSLRAKLEAEGYDGIRLPEQNAWVAFHSEQIKSASANRGTFDAGNPNIYFSRDTNDRGEREQPGVPPEPFSHSTESMQNMDGAVSTSEDSTLQRLKDWMRGKYEDFVPAMLGAVQRRFLTELMAGHKALRGAKQYDEDVQALNATRQQLLAGAPDADEHPDDMLKHGAAAIADDLRAYTHVKGPGGWLGAKTEQGRVLAGVMHDSTILGVDPSKPYEPLKMQNSRGEWVTWTPALVKQRIAVLKEVMLGRPGDDKRAMMEEIKTLRSLKFRENERTRAYPALVARYEALPAKGKQLFQQVRDWHAQYSEALQAALEARIEALRGGLKKGDPELAEKHLRMLTHKLRAEFEASRVQGIYFPLNRDGDFWVSYTDKTGAQGFQMFESAAAQERFVKATRQAGGKVVVQGRRSEKGMAKDAPPGTLIAEVIGTLKQSGVADSIQDDIYQLFLRTLPEMSMRKHAIHRKATPGFSDDITRGFAKNAFHGAHQLARLQYAHRLQSTIDQLQENMDAFRANPDAGSLEVSRGDALLAELKKRHQYLMSPTDSQLANMANSIGFLWFLGASPASALVNLTQNVQVTLPVLGAHHGWPKAMRELGRAVRDSMKTGGNIHRTLKDPDELRAYNMLRARGDIDKTRSHDLAGLSEGSLIQTNPVWAKVMTGMTWLFHKAEVVNRESAGMAAYRLARQRGDDFTQAVQYASDIINGTHFDYSADNRPRFMQGNTARVALQFKNYSVSMTTLLYRNLYQAFKGETPEVRRVARRTLTGILGMTGLLAGTIGLPIINVMRFAAGAAHAAFGDDDDPWDFDTEFRNWLAEHFGDTAAGWIADGVVSHVTGVNIAGRVSLSDMWFRDSDRELEGKDQYYQYIDALLGPLAGAAKNAFIGSKMIGDGHTLRGIETMLPSFAKNAMKGYRYASQGVNSLAGAPIVSDVNSAEAFAQLIGLQPTSVAEQYRINSAKKAYGEFIVHRRTSLRNAYAMAVEQRDSDARRAAQDKIVAFNRRWPIAAIRPGDIRASLRGRARARADEHGIHLPRRLQSTLEQMVNPTRQ